MLKLYSIIIILIISSTAYTQNNPANTIKFPQAELNKMTEQCLKEL